MACSICCSWSSLGCVVWRLRNALSGPRIGGVLVRYREVKSTRGEVWYRISRCSGGRTLDRDFPVSMMDGGSCTVHGGREDKQRLLAVSIECTRLAFFVPTNLYLSLHLLHRVDPSPPKSFRLKFKPCGSLAFFVRPFFLSL